MMHHVEDSEVCKNSRAQRSIHSVSTYLRDCHLSKPTATKTEIGRLHAAANLQITLLFSGARRGT